MSRLAIASEVGCDIPLEQNKKSSAVTAELFLFR